MRIRSSHVVVATVFLIGLFVIVAALVLRQSEPVGRSSAGYVPPKSEDGEKRVPVIEAELESVDLGTIPNVRESKDDLPQTEIAIYNRGNATLNISDVQTSCVCTQGYLEKTTLRPGEQTTMRIEVDPYGVHGFESHKVLSIASNDPVNAKLDIHVLAKIDPEFAIEPETVDFGTVEKGQPAEIELTMRQVGEQPIGLREIITPNGIESEWSPVPVDQRTEPDKEEYRIRVRLGADAPIGRVPKALVIRNELKRPTVAAFRVPVNAVVTSFYKLDPGPQVRFFNGKPGERVYTTRIVAESPVEITELAVGSEALHVSAEPGDTPNSARIQVAVAEGAAPGHVQTGITFNVRSGDKSAPQKLDVSGWIADSAAVAASGVPSS